MKVQGFTSNHIMLIGYFQEDIWIIHGKPKMYPFMTECPINDFNEVEWTKRISIKLSLFTS